MRPNRQNTFKQLAVFLAILQSPAIGPAPVGDVNAVIAKQLPSPDISGVVKGGTKPVVLAAGLAGADDPIAWGNGELIFSEPMANRLLRVDAKENISTFIQDLHEPRGLAVDSQGKLISIQAQEGFTALRVIYPASSTAVIADRFEGTAFSRPNDLVVDEQGGIYFTDPGQFPEQEAELRKTKFRLPPAIYYVAPRRPPVKVADGIARPNGITLSPNGKILYVNDTLGLRLTAFDVQADGSLRNRRVFAEYKGRAQRAGSSEPVSNADGIVVDNSGRVYALTEAGVEVFSTTGTPLGIIPVACNAAGARCQGLAFAGSDKRTLYLAGQGTLLKIPMVAQGFLKRVK
jgi:gluconolactonase